MAEDTDTRKDADDDAPKKDGGLKAAEYPGVSEAPPAPRASEPPAKASVAPPTKASEPPPAKASVPPVKASEPPAAKASEPPAKASVPPIEASEPPAKTSEPPAKKSEPPAKAAEDEDEVDESDEDEHEDEVDEPEEADPEEDEPEAADADEADEAVVVAPRPHDVRPVTPPAPAASLGKSVTAFMMIMLALAAGFWFLGNAESPFGKSGQPKWKIGQQVPITLTLDPADDTKLSCASDADIGGKHCEYKTRTEKFAGKLDDATMLRPYRTTGEQDNVGLLAAGVWGIPELAAGKRPNGRFNLKCTYKVEGKVTRPAVRWDVSGPWGEQDSDWFAGSVSSCTVQK